MFNRNFLNSVILTIILAVFLLVHGFGFTQILELQFIVALSIYFNNRTTGSIVYVTSLLLVSDAAIGANPSFSIISFALGGGVLSLIGRFTPLTRRSPFILARIFWLGFSLTVLLTISGEIVNLDLLNIVGVYLLNLIVLILFTYVLGRENAVNKSSDIIV